MRLDKLHLFNSPRQSMLRKNNLGFLIIAGVMIQAACSEIKKDTGYSKIDNLISKDSATVIKNSIKAMSNDNFKPGQYTGTNKTTINYRLLSPAQTNTKDKYPLVLVLHGSGAVGTDNVTQLGVLVKLWDKPAIREKYPAYILAPQFPVRSSNYVQDKNKNVLISTPDACLSTALQLIDSLKKVLPINGRKVYVIGFSMGGSGTINSLDLRPDLFAAGISISGIPDFNRTNTLPKIPLWIVHGNADNENSMTTDSLFYKELNALNDHYIKFWEIDKLDHDIYSPLYTSDLIPKWLFRHEK